MTRMWFIGIVLVCALGLAGCAGSSAYMVKADPPTAGPPPDQALLYVMRPSGMGFAINFQIWDRERFIGLSQAKSYFAYACTPGKHLFIGIAENKVAVEADLAPGKSYYILTAPMAWVLSYPTKLKDGIAFTMLVLELIFRPTGILGERLAVKKA